jgi:predicted RNA methylase
MAPPTGNAALADVAHLTYREKTNLGSFYTPLPLVSRVYEILLRHAGNDAADVILETSCGYGAFFAVPHGQAWARLVGADIDPEALAVARDNFPFVTFHETNALAEISRAKYDIGEKERLVIVGNPPYNDVTSHVKNRVKAAPCAIDESVRTRDLGLSFLLSFARLAPSFIAVLHPLSYLIKEANFKILRPLMRHYVLRDAMVFNSQAFAETSKSNGFPIVIALYARDPRGTTYADIVRRRFHTLEGASFSLADFDYVCRYITKYPSRPSRRPAGEVYRFYTMRDINALKRSRTFIREDTDNTVYIQPDKLPYYCYVDVFKDFASALPYYFGNLDVMFDHAEFAKIKDDFVLLSAAKHPGIFPANVVPDRGRYLAARDAVQTYFKRLFAPHRCVHQSQN